MGVKTQTCISCWIPVGLLLVSKPVALCCTGLPAPVVAWGWLIPTCGMASSGALWKNFSLQASSGTAEGKSPLHELTSFFNPVSFSVLVASMEPRTAVTQSCLGCEL